jgi:hypothetical protein|uniref:Uncharacterized protein n=1 Tax=viral metagenome TaxID=1070528 RepID=A0A6C0JE50_9ZZZZ
MDKRLEEVNVFTRPYMGALIFYVSWIFIHYVTVHLYAYWCTPFGIIGLLTSPFTVTTPICRGLEWSIHNGSTIINNMWIIIGSWLMTHIFTTKLN